MFDDAALDILRLSSAGYCCSQIFVKLFLEEMNRENSDLIRAMGGLCLGMGNCAGSCGILAGGACVLGLYGGKGTDREQSDQRLALMLAELNEWFHEHCSKNFGGSSCGQILGGDTSTPNPAICGELLLVTYGQVRTILVQNDFNPARGRE